MEFGLVVPLRSILEYKIHILMHKCFYGECAELADTVEAIKGLKLSRGFSGEVKKRIGGRNGCIHLMTLLLAMAPAALQGYWVNNDRDPKRRRLPGGHLKQYLVDSCRVWRREGSLVQEIADAANITLAPQNDQGTGDV